MISLKVRAACAAWLALACTGCVLFADKADYADYRKIRLAEAPSDRALAMQGYVARHPRGRWKDEIAEARKSEDLPLFEAGKDTRVGLEHYLAAYPDGTFVAQARSRLQAVELIEKQRQQAAAEVAQLGEARKLRAEELRRTWLGRFMGYWLNTLANLRGWGEPIPDVARLNPQFSRAFGALPRPRCTQDECVKYYTSPYAVPVPGGNRIERNLSLLLRLRMRAGKLERAELLLPERGFTHWYELENRHAVASGDRAARVTAIAWAVEHALPSITALGDVFVPFAPSATSPANAAPTLPTIDAPAIGPTGETVDTSIETPSDPQNRVGEDNAGIGVNAVKPRNPDAADYVKPQAPQAAPDMKFDAVGVGKQGQRVEVAPQAAPAAPEPAAGSGAATEMLFTAPLEVPKNGAPDTTAAAQPSAAGAATPAGEPIRPVVRTFQGQGLRIVLFAAGSEGPGYDGIVVERIGGRGKRAAAAKVAAPAATIGTGSGGAPAAPATATPPSTP